MRGRLWVILDKRIKSPDLSFPYEGFCLYKGCNPAERVVPATDSHCASAPSHGDGRRALRHPPTEACLTPHGGLHPPMR